MNMPGFSADFSLKGASYSFSQRWRHQVATDGVQPALVCNPDCLDQCVMDCSDCDDLPNPASRARCRAFCIRQNAACRRRCCR